MNRKRLTYDPYSSRDKRISTFYWFMRLVLMPELCNIRSPGKYKISNRSASHTTQFGFCNADSYLEAVFDGGGNEPGTLSLYGNAEDTKMVESCVLGLELLRREP